MGEFRATQLQICHVLPWPGPKDGAQWEQIRAAARKRSGAGAVLERRHCQTLKKMGMKRYETGWWFGPFFIFHNIWDNPSHWLIFFKMVETTNQEKMLGFSRSLGFQWFHPENVSIRMIYFLMWPTMFVAIKNHDIQPVSTWVLDFNRFHQPNIFWFDMFLGRADTKEGRSFLFLSGFYVHKWPLGIELTRNGDRMGIPCGYVTSNSSGWLAKKKLKDTPKRTDMMIVQ
jgi:hypothetical protein